MSIKIYCYTNTFNNMKYVGQTSKSLKERAGSNGVNYLSSKYLGPDIKKYGWHTGFSSEILAEVEDKEYANLLEWFYTLELNTQWPNGYNSDIGRKHSREHVLAIQAKTKGRPNYKNRHPFTEEHRRNLSKAHIGKPCPWNSYKRSDETKEKIRQVQHSEEVKQKTHETKLPMINAYRNENPLNLKWNDFCHWYKENCK